MAHAKPFRNLTGRESPFGEATASARRKLLADSTPFSAAAVVPSLGLIRHRPTPP
jgi:hypothetical protein